ncbi:MAG: PmoA family protein [Planctomycetia bacterium]|nr:PmoA family protein [Planctomycetia bacterium]
MKRFGYVMLLLSFGVSVFGEEASPFRLEEKGREMVVLKDGDQPVWEFAYRIKELPELTFGSRQRFASAGWFHPVYGLHGETLTSSMAEKYHMHHHGIWSSFMNIFVREADGKITSYNTWMDHTRLKKDFIAWEKKEATPEYYRFTVHLGWFRCRYGENPLVPVPEENYLDEKLTVTTYAVEQDPKFGKCRKMDFEYSWTPTKYEMRLAGDKAGKRAFASLAMRFAVVADGLKPRIFNEKGQIPEDDSYLPCEWVDYVYPFQGKDKPESGVAIYPDKENLPSEGWAIRHYGLVSTGWPNLDGYTIQPGQTVTLKYRMVIHENVPPREEEKPAENKK